MASVGLAFYGGYAIKEFETKKDMQKKLEAFEKERNNRESELQKEIDSLKMAGTNRDKKVESLEKDVLTMKEILKKNGSL